MTMASIEGSAEHMANGQPRPGVFSAQMLREAIREGAIRAKTKIDERQIQPASLDVRLGARAYRLRSSFLPGTARVRDRLGELQLGPALDLNDPNGVVLEPGRPYLIELMETLRLPEGVSARANPRSSTGRLDIFTRVISDHGSQFDEIEAGYAGPLWLELYSSTFTVAVRAGIALTQLRLGRSTQALSPSELTQLHDEDGLLFAPGGEPRPRVEAPAIGARGLLVGVHLPAKEFVGWRARHNTALLDLSVTAAYDPLDYWEPVFAEAGGRLVLHPDDFHLLMSKEYVRIPPRVAAEMVAYDPTNGELRTHYAGFFDPGFGYGEGLHGTRAVLEVRAHDVPFMLEDGQPIARLAYEWMAEPPDRLYGSDELRSHFQHQGVNLSRQFRPMEADMAFRFLTRD
jgi:dCTP deaminase